MQSIFNQFARVFMRRYIGANRMQHGVVRLVNNKTTLMLLLPSLALLAPEVDLRWFDHISIVEQIGLKNCGVAESPDCKSL